MTIRTPYHPSRFTKRLTYSLVLLFALLATLYSLLTPGWETPDEQGHYQYILHVRQQGTLPIQGHSATFLAYHTPLYYLIAMLFSLPADLSQPIGTMQVNPHFMYHGHGNDINFVLHKSDETFPYQHYALFLHLARLASVAMGTLTVWFALQIGREIYPQQVTIPLLSASLLAFNPQFLFISGAISNDNLVTLAVTGGLWQFLRILKEPAATRHWFRIGLWVAVAILAKISGLLSLVLPALALVVMAQRRRCLTFFIRNGIAFATPVLLGTLWWFIRNWQIYGDPLGWASFLEISRGCCLRTGNLTWADIQDFFFTQFKSFWAAFGWMNIWASPRFYQMILLLYLVGLLGLGWLLLRQRDRLTLFQKQALASCGFLVILFEGYMLWTIRHFNSSWYQGRYIFPIIVPLMILLATGICHLIPQRYQKVAISLIAATLLSCALYMPFALIVPTYPTITLPKWRLFLLPYQTDYNFDNLIHLRGYRFDVEKRQEKTQQQAQTETSLSLELYWQADQRPDFDYTVFVHLVGKEQQILAQVDQIPGETRQYPPTQWEVQDIIAERYRLVIPQTDEQQPLTLQVGLYHWQNGERVSILEGDAMGKDFVSVEIPSP